MTTEVEDFLEHYGVKGMKWGVRRDPAKRLERMNADNAVLGYGLRGYSARKVNKRYLRKHKLSEFTIKEHAKLPEKERKKYDAKIKRGAYAAGGRVFVEGLLIGGAAGVAIKKLNIDPKSKEMIKAGGVFMAGMGTYLAAKQMKAVRDSYEMDKLRKEVHGN